jgi:hypothetical protein
MFMEPKMTTATTVDVSELVRQVREDGFCVLKEAYPRQALSECYQAFRPIFDRFVATHEPNRGPGRYYLGVPMYPPFYNCAFFDNDTVNAVLDGVLGKGMTIQAYSTDTPINGSQVQDFHSDLPPLFPEQPQMFHPPALIALNFSFLDVTEAHGPFQIVAGTHRMDKQQAMAKIESGQLPILTLPLAVGDVLIRDPRCLHRGTANTTDTPRIVAVVGYVRKWFHWENVAMEPIPSQTWNAFSQRERQLFRSYEPGKA